MTRHEYQLRLSIGTRQGPAGSEWELDLCLGGFDVDRFTYTGALTFELRAAEAEDDRQLAQREEDWQRLTAAQGEDGLTPLEFATLLDKSEKTGERRSRRW